MSGPKTDISADMAARPMGDDGLDTTEGQGGLRSSLRYVPLAFVGLVVVALLALLLYGVFAGGGDDTLAVRKRPAPDFVLSLFDGREISLADFAGKVVVLNFWASWCDPCEAEAPVLEDGWQAYADQGVAVIGVDTDDTDEDARAFIERHNLTYYNGPESGNLSVKYGVLGLPETYFIDQEGMIVRRWVGEISDEQLASFVKELLP